MLRFLAYGAVALAIYSAYLLVTRSFGWGDAILDWVFLGLSVLSVLLWPSARDGNRKHLIVLMAALLLLLFWWTFWFLAFVFGEGL